MLFSFLMDFSPLTLRANLAGVLTESWQPPVPTYNTLLAIEQGSRSHGFIGFEPLFPLLVNEFLNVSVLNLAFSKTMIPCEPHLIENTF